MTVARATRLRLVDEAVVRVAAWPLETVIPFASPALAEAADQLDDAEAAVLDRREAVVAALHAAVPLLGSRAARAWLLDVKRRVHNGPEPLPSAPPAVQAELSALPDLSALLADETASRQTLAERAATFAADYATKLAQERQALAQAVAEPRFQRALALSAPDVADRWVASGGPIEASTARGRRLEATLFHYLLRAIGRPTPNGAWAGVAPVHPAAATAAEGLGDSAPTNRGWTVTQTPGRHLATPNLLPFAIMAQALVGEARYRQRAALRLNPSLVGDSAKGWRYLARLGGGAVWRELAANPLTSAVVRHYEDGEARPLAPLLDALVGGNAALGERIAGALDALAQRDVLRVDLALPAAAADVWVALDALWEGLLPDDRPAWTAAVARIREHCEQLGRDFDQLEPAAIGRLRRAVAGEVATLWAACGLTGRPPGPPLLLDMRAPTTLSWDERRRAEAECAINERLRFHAADGGATLYRRLTLAPIVAALKGDKGVTLPALLARLPEEPADEASAPPPIPFSRAAIFSRFPLDAATRRLLAEQDEHWQAQIAGHEQERTLTLAYDTDSAFDPGLAGALLLPSDGGLGYWTGPGRPQPGLFLSRFAPLLVERDGDEAPAVTALRAALARAAAQIGAVPAEVVSGDTFNPNAALRPSLTDSRLDADGATGLPPRLLEVTADQTDDEPRLVLRRVGDGAPLLPVFNSGAALGATDPLSALLSQLAFSQGWEFVSFGLPALPAEVESWGHLPRLRSPGGVVISPERWTIPAETVAALCAASGPERHRLWRREARRRGLPSLVQARSTPHEPELLFPTDSPLALRCLFDTLGGEAPPLVLSELTGEGLLVDANESRYLAELGVTWVMEGEAGDGAS